MWSPDEGAPSDNQAVVPWVSEPTPHQAEDKCHNKPLQAYRGNGRGVMGMNTILILILLMILMFVLVGAFWGAFWHFILKPLSQAAKGLFLRLGR